MWYLGTECASGEPNLSGVLRGDKSHKFATAEGPILQLKSLQIQKQGTEEEICGIYFESLLICDVSKFSGQ